MPKKQTCEQKKMKKVMGEFKRGELRMPGKKVVNRKQAIAIGMSEGRRKCKK